MSKKIKGIIIGGIVLVLMVGAIIALVLTKPKEETSNSSSSVTYDVNKSNVSFLNNLKINNKNGDYEIKKIDNSKKEIPSLAGYSLDNNMLETAYITFANITSKKIIEENAQDVVKYGLTQDTASIIADGIYDDKNVKLIIGKELPDKSGYYGMLENDKKVYVIESNVYATLNLTANDYLDKLMIKKPDGEPTPAITKIEINKKNINKPIIISKSNSQLNSETEISYEITSPVIGNLDNNLTSKIINSVYGLTAAQVVSPNPTDSQKSEFGFSNPTANVTFWYNGINTTLTIGNNYKLEGSEIDYAYVMVSGSNFVYGVTIANLPWITTSVDDMLSSLVINSNIDTVKNVEIISNGNTYNFELNGTGNDLKVSLNRNEINTDYFRDFYIEILSMKAESVATDKLEGASDLTIKLNYNDGKNPDVFEFVKNGARKYIIIRNGIPSYDTNSSYVTKFKEDLEKIINNQSIK